MELTRYTTVIPEMLDHEPLSVVVIASECEQKIKELEQEILRLRDLLAKKGGA
jgi:uncharacterized small protein (DUF1192 family)